MLFYELGTGIEPATLNVLPTHKCFHPLSYPNQPLVLQVVLCEAQAPKQHGRRSGTRTHDPQINYK